MDYNKLVRDRIPEIIHKDGRQCETEIMDDLSYRAALRTKLIEEATEAAEPDADLVKELADLYEVIDAMLITFKISKEAVLATQKQRRQERGGFNKKLKLIRVD